MKYFVDCRAFRDGDGSSLRPFKRINDAARVAKPGDVVSVAPGTYREYVNPNHAGSAEAPIQYLSEEPLAAIITGAEIVRDWEQFEGDTWFTRINNSLFGAYNPYTTVIGGDWYMSRSNWHTGEVYLDGQSLYEVETIEEVLNPAAYTRSWGDHEWTKKKWFTRQDGDYTEIYVNLGGKDPHSFLMEINVRRNCFFPDEYGVNYITLSGFTVKQAATTWAPPTAFQDGMVGPNWSKGWIIEDCEISDSKCSGISLGKYLQPNNENKWVRKKFKDGTQNERDAICQAQREGWTKELVGSHIVRRCHIHSCEQTGIVGHLGCAFSVIEDNHIHHINNKQQLLGAEIAGIKMHAAIDVIYRRNHIHHSYRGLWLDWQAQGTRVTQNLMHDNMPPLHVKDERGYPLCEDLFIEVSHGPTLVDNNIFLSLCAGRFSTQGMAFVHNLFAGTFTGVGAGTDQRNGQPRYTPYHVPHRTEVNGFMSFLHGDVRFYNNIFIQKEIPEEFSSLVDWATGKMDFTVGTKPYDGYPTEEEWLALFGEERPMFNDPTGASSLRFERYFHKLPVWTGGNVYLNGARPCDKEVDFHVIDEDVEFSLSEDNGSYYLSTDLYKYLPAINTAVISTELLGEAFEPEQLFENPDGTAIVFDTDYYGDHFSVNPLPGPFASGEKLGKRLFENRYPQP